MLACLGPTPSIKPTLIEFVPNAVGPPEAARKGHEIRIFEDSVLVASHAPLEGRSQKRLDPAHRKLASYGSRIEALE